jgi:hypothetical protein
MLASTPESIRKRYIDRVADLRARKDLSEEGRRRQIAKARTDADAAMRESAKADQANRDKRHAELLARIFGNPKPQDSTSVVSYRDAQDRAAGLKTPEQAAALLSRARSTGDRLLAQAVAMRALDGAMGANPGTGWDAVLDDWATEQPSGVDEALTELGQLNREQSTRGKFARNLHYALPAASELRGHNTERLAAEADPEQAEAPDPAPWFKQSRELKDEIASQFG